MKEANLDAQRETGLFWCGHELGSPVVGSISRDPLSAAHIFVLLIPPQNLKRYLGGGGDRERRAEERKVVVVDVVVGMEKYHSL